MPKLADCPPTFIGIDPGKSGGIAFITNKEVHYTKMPSTERDIWNFFESITSYWNNTPSDFFAIIEKVHAMPGQGVTSMFSFGQNYGFLRACLIAAEIPFEEVTPRTWQKGLGVPAKKKNAPKKEHKQNLLKKAQQLFPQESIWKEPRSKGKQLAICDALLIAEYCRRIKR